MVSLASLPRDIHILIVTSLNVRDRAILSYVSKELYQKIYPTVEHVSKWVSSKAIPEDQREGVLRFLCFEGSRTPLNVIYAPVGTNEVAIPQIFRWACDDDETEIVRWIFNWTVKPRPEDFKRAFFSLCIRGGLSVIKVFHDKNFDLTTPLYPKSVQTENQQDGLTLACENGQLEVVKYLRENAIFSTYLTALDRAISTHQVPIVQYLLINYPISQQEVSKRIVECSKGITHSKVLQALTAHTNGCKNQLQDTEVNLFLADVLPLLISNSIPELKLIFDQVELVPEITEFLFEAIKGGFNQSALYLLERYPTIDLGVGNYIFSPFWCALERNRYIVLEKMLEREDVRVLVKTIPSQTALMAHFDKIRVQGEAPECIQLLGTCCGALRANDLASVFSMVLEFL